MPHRSQIRWNFWNMLRNEDAKKVLIFGQKWPFLVLLIFEFFHSRYWRTLHKSSFAHNRNFFAEYAETPGNAKKWLFWPNFLDFCATSFFNRFQKFQRIEDLWRKDFFHTKLGKKIWDLTHPNLYCILGGFYYVMLYPFLAVL